MADVTKSSLILPVATLLVALMAAPSAIVASQLAVDYILDSYLVMIVQMDGLRLGCF